MEQNDSDYAEYFARQEEELIINIKEDCEAMIKKCNKDIKTEFYSEQLGFLRGRKENAIRILNKINNNKE